MDGMAAYRSLSKAGVKMRWNIRNRVTASLRNFRVALSKLFGKAGSKKVSFFLSIIRQSDAKANCTFARRLVLFLTLACAFVALD